MIHCRHFRLLRAALWLVYIYLKAEVPNLRGRLWLQFLPWHPVLFILALLRLWDFLEMFGIFQNELGMNFGWNRGWIELYGFCQRPYFGFIWYLCSRRRHWRDILPTGFYIIFHNYFFWLWKVDKKCKNNGFWASEEIDQFDLFCSSTIFRSSTFSGLRPKPYFDFFGQTLLRQKTLLRPKLYFDLYFSTNKKSRFDKMSKYRGRSKRIEVKISKYRGRSREVEVQKRSNIWKWLKYRKSRTDVYVEFLIFFKLFFSFGGFLRVNMGQKYRSNLKRCVPIWQNLFSKPIWTDRIFFYFIFAKLKKA